MKFVVGLGNPGQKYDLTRHNVGFDVIDRVARQLAPGEPATSKFDSLVIETRINDEKVVLMKPQTYMNRSGQSVKQAMTFYKANSETDLLVIVDDIHLPCGTLRMRATGSSGGHNGLQDISNHIGNDSWSRLRIGVDEPGHIPQADYVLGKFTPQQKESVEPALCSAVKAVDIWIEHGVSDAMNICNENGNSDIARNLS